MIFICVGDLAQIWEKNGVWFKSNARVMVGIRKPSDLNQEDKTIWNLFVWLESQDLCFKSLDSSQTICWFEWEVQTLPGNFSIQCDLNKEILRFKSGCFDSN